MIPCLSNTIVCIEGKTLLSPVAAYIVHTVHYASIQWHSECCNISVGLIVLIGTSTLIGTNIHLTKEKGPELH